MRLKPTYILSLQTLVNFNSVFSYLLVSTLHFCQILMWKDNFQIKAYICFNLLAGRVRCQTHNENNNKWNRTYNKRKRTEINKLKELERDTCQRVHNAHPDLAIEPNHVDLKGEDGNVVLKLDPSNFKMLPESNYI